MKLTVIVLGVHNFFNILYKAENYFAFQLYQPAALSLVVECYVLPFWKGPVLWMKEWDACIVDIFSPKGAGGQKSKKN